MTERKEAKECAKEVPATHSLLDKTIIDIFGISDTERNVLFIEPLAKVTKAVTPTKVGVQN